MRKRLTAALLCLCLLFTLLPATAFAEGEPDSGPPPAQSALCEHHPQHDESCGYTEGTEGSPCTHEHTEDCYTLVTKCVHTHTEDCYPADDTATPSDAEEKEPVCGHVCSEESGCITMALDCKHEHDEACGYVPATEGTSCTFVCEVCNTQDKDSGTTATPSDAQPEECTCETLCTGEEINEDCPVCSVEGAELDKVCVGVAPMLPVTALAAGPNTVYVGGVDLVGSPDNIVYATTNESGEVVKDGANANNYNIKWDGSTLTLHDATIQKDLYASDLPLSNIAGAAIGVINQSGDAGLTITLEGTNTIKDVSAAIHVFALSGSASLTITGDGILSASSGFNPGIRVQSSTGNGTLAITGAKVTASSSYSGNGVQIRCGDSSNASLTVNGGSLTATGSGATFAGIQLLFGSGGSGSGTPTVTVSGNAIVRANGSAGGITSNSSTGVQTKADTDGTDGTGGIVFDGNTGTVYGDVELQEDLEIGEGESLKLDSGASLNAGGHNVIVDGGTLGEGFNLGDSVKYAPTITTHPKNVEVKEKETATFTVEATGSDLSYQWQQSTDNGSKWTNITGETNTTYTIATTTMDMNGTQYRCVVTGYGTAAESNAATLTVQKATTPIDPKYVRYIVEHYKQNTDGSYTLADTEQPIDEIGKTVTATPKTYEGYTYNPNAAGTVVNGTLKEISSPDDIVTLKLYYDITLYTVTVNGSYAQTTGAGSYAKDATVTIDAGTRSGYTFDGWTSADGVTFANAGSAQTTFTMPDKAVTVTANWKKNSGGGSSYDYYTITASAGTGGSISPSGSVSVREDTDKTFTITPDSGYHISDVLVDGKSVGAVASYTFDNVRRSHTIEATFAKGNPATGNPFTDVHPDDWFYDHVMFVYQNGLMNGTSATTFSPNEAATRAQVAVIFYRMAGSPAVTGDSPFTDVENGPGTAWYYNAVLWAQQNGIVSGYGDGTFHPGTNITREQLAVIFYNYAKLKGYDVSAVNDLSGFTDAGDVSDWALPAMRWAVGNGIMGGYGDGILGPQGTATRAQVAAMLRRFIENNKLVPPAVLPGGDSGTTGTGGTGSGGGGWTQQVTSPQTGDSSNIGLWFSLMLLSLSGIVALLVTEKVRRRRMEDEEAPNPLMI